MRILNISIILTILLLTYSCTKLTEIIPKSQSKPPSDLHSPTITILYPSELEIITTNSIVVSGTASDDIEVKEVFLRLGTNGNFGKVNGTKNWNTNLSQLPEGTNEIFVFAVDVVGKTSSTNSVKFIVDITKPTISISSPEELEIFTNDNITISGNASDNIDIKEVFLRLGNNGSFGKVNGTKNWNTNLSQIPEGTNEIFVFAVDVAGKTSSTNSVKFIVDITKPTISISSPEELEIFTNDNITISGNASDNIDIKEVFLRLGNNGSFGKVNGTTTWNTNLSQIPDGTNEIFVFAVDVAGNVSTTNSKRFIYIKQAIFVSSSGDDNNSGIFSSAPVKSINKGIELSVLSNFYKVYVAQGIYTPGSGLNTDTFGIWITNNNITIIGGWNDSFNSITGYSTLDGTFSTNVVVISNSSKIVFQNFHIIRGNSTLPGGGIRIVNSTNCFISNLIVSSNYRSGIYVSGESNIVTYSIILSNLTDGDQHGGGIKIEGRYNIVDNCIITNNVAKSGSGGLNPRGGGVFLGGNYNILRNSTIVGNSSGVYGGGINISSSYNYISNCLIFNNSANNGGGINSEGSDHIISTVIVSNMNSPTGAIRVVGNRITISNSIIVSNQASDLAGVIYITTSSSLKILDSYIVNLSSPAIGGSPSGLIISNCYIGGNNPNSYKAINCNVSELKANVFITNTLFYLYKDIVSNDNWTDINDPSKTGASTDSTNNTVTNL